MYTLIFFTDDDEEEETSEILFFLFSFSIYFGFLLFSSSQFPSLIPNTIKIAVHAIGDLGMLILQ